MDKVKKPEPLKEVCVAGAHDAVLAAVLDEYWDEGGMDDYARIRVEVATAPLHAEIERLEQSLDKLRGEHVRKRRALAEAESQRDTLAEVLGKVVGRCVVDPKSELGIECAEALARASQPAKVPKNEEDT